MTLVDNDDFSELEARLRRDLRPLADAMLVEQAPAAATPVDVNGRNRSRPRRQRWLLAAAAGLVVAAAAAAIWQASDDNRIETGPISPAPDQRGDGEPNEEESTDVDQTTDSATGQWTALPPSPPGVPIRGHMVSVWTGDEALYWGGRSGNEGTPQAFVGGVAFNPATDSWRQIGAPQWAHPGGTGIYNDGWVYVTAKGSVTRFDPDSGTEEELALDGRLSARVVATDGAVVVAIGPAAGGLGFQVVGPSSGDLAIIEGYDELTTALAAPAWEMQALGWARNEYALVMPDQSAWLLSLDGGAALARQLEPPAGSGNHRVELVATSSGPRVVHLETGDGTARTESVTILGPVDGAEWGVAGDFGDLDALAVAGAGEWVVLLPPESSPVALVPPAGSAGPALASVALELPLGRDNPNAVWTGQELIVWGGNPSNSADGSIAGTDIELGGRIRLPAVGPLRQSDPDPESDAAIDAVEQASVNDTAEDSVKDAADETEFQALLRALDQLPDEQRIPDGPYDESGREKFDHQWTADGLWVYSRPDPAESSRAQDAGEILLLEDWGGPIIDSWLLGYFPGGYGGQIEVSDDSVYCMYAGDGGLPDSQFCRLDRFSGQLSLIIHPSEVDGGDEPFYDDLYTGSGIDWTVVPAANSSVADITDGSGAVRPFGSLYLEEVDGVLPPTVTPTLVDSSGSVRLDPETLNVVDVEDFAATGERVYPCPFRGEGLPPIDDSGDGAALPPAVEATRAAILEAAASCDVEALEALSGGSLTVPGRDGGWGMIALAFMLSSSADAVPSGPEGDQSIVYTFPGATIGLSRGEIEAVTRFYGPDKDEYQDHLTVILDDGTWQVANR